MLSVLYDDECAFCVRCRELFTGYEPIAPVRFVPASSPLARELCAGKIPGFGLELVVVDSSGAYWSGPAAFLVCLWAFDETRALASLLGLPLLRWFGAWFFRFVSHNRGALSSLFGLRCDGHCAIPKATSPYR